MANRKSKTKGRQKRSEWILILSLIVASVATIGLGIAYQQDYFSNTKKKPTVKAMSPSSKALNQSCQQKLKEYLAQGGVDIAQKMHYGDLQGCDFSSSAEQQARQADKSKRSFNLSAN